MKVGEFQKQIFVTANAYSRFMGQHGPYKGAESSVYMSAWSFFKKREMRGIKTKPNKKAKTDDVAGKDAVPSVDDIELDVEKEDAVQIYGKPPTTPQENRSNMTIDTCDEVRRKINAHLKKPGVTQAAFLRCASASYHKVPKKLTSTRLSTFRSKKGAYEGNTSDMFYGAYVYFEKLRIKEGKPKSKKRQEMEDIHAHTGGLVINQRMDRFICHPDQRPSIDSFGRVSIR